MAARDRGGVAGAGTTVPSPPDGAGWFLAATTALYVARPLVPSDAVGYLGNGVVFVMLWLVLALVWLVRVFRSRARLVRWGWIDTAVLVLVSWHSVSALAAVRVGSPRPALNMMWEWIALAAAFFLARQVATTAAARRGMMVAMIAVASGLAAIGYAQFFWGMQRDRAEYDEIKDNPAKMLQAVGQWFPPGSAERKQFEDRVNSREPTATFALTNSLAGYLAPWLVVVAGLGVSQRRSRAGGRFWPCTALAFFLGGCLLLTKSRSGVLAVLVGLALLGRTTFGGGRPVRRRLVVGLLLVLLLVLGVLALGGMDREVWTEAGKSLAYRGQYWRSTLRMIGDQPWLGCGPGQFQDTYTRWKLPQASEEIRDPHNFLLEVWATAGTPALVALLAVLGLFARRVVRSFRRRQDHHRPSAAAAEGGVFGFVAVGVMAGLVLATVVAPLVELAIRPESLLIGIAVLLATLWLLRPYASGRSHELAAIGVVVLLINLLAAGGIGYPGVAGSLWLLLAVGMNDTDDDRATFSAPAPVVVGLLVAVFLLGFTCYQTAYRPVLASRWRLAAIFSDQLLRDDDKRERALVEALQADPRSRQAARLLAAHRYDQWSRRPTATAIPQLAEAFSAWLRLAPRSSAAWSQVGRWWSGVHDRTGDGRALVRARHCYERATEFYPTNALVRVEYALVLERSGLGLEARRQAQVGLQMDRIMRTAGHSEKTLPEELRQQAERI